MVQGPKNINRFGCFSWVEERDLRRTAHGSVPVRSVRAVRAELKDIFLPTAFLEEADSQELFGRLDGPFKQAP